MAKIVLFQNMLHAFIRKIRINPDISNTFFNAQVFYKLKYYSS